MANIASNEIMVHFKKGTPLPVKVEFVNELNDKVVAEPYNEAEPTDNEDCLELSYGTKWSEQRELLQDLCNKYDLEITGVVYEWGCSYVNSFELKPIKE